jgi:NOL1/NOP2/sun family putative RNA methylase
VQHCAFAYYYDEAAPGKSVYHEAGAYYIQEASATLPVTMLSVDDSGQRVLDLCAAPGGKSTQIADLMNGRGLLVSNEIVPSRASILSENTERMGVENALVISSDPIQLADRFPAFFDRILVDAPCSGEGMFRKNEIATTEWSPDNVKLCAERQAEILDNAAKMLLPGGRLVYSTCTVSPEENEQTIAGFLLRHSDLHSEALELTGGIENGRPDWAKEITADPDVLRETENSGRLWPHKVRGEGHFLFVLKRDGSTDRSAQKNYVPGGRFVRAKKEVVKVYTGFAGETLNKELEGEYLSFGDQLYLAPADMPNPNGLKVLRCGLHLGTIKKDRFEPSHALALALSSEDVKLSYDLSSDSTEIRQFLNGQTIRLSGDSPDAERLKSCKGWCLITTDGYSAGWAKLAGGMLKNHYPKGLRINNL